MSLREGVPARGYQRLTSMVEVNLVSIAGNSGAGLWRAVSVAPLVAGPVVLGLGAVFQTAETLWSLQGSELGSRNQMKGVVQSVKDYDWGVAVGALREWYLLQVTNFS